MTFPLEYQAIQNRMKELDPLAYSQTRNYKDGAVSHLSPYISRGVISTKQVMEYVLALDLPWNYIEKLIQELAWRDYWQQIWIEKGEAINQDLKHPQTGVRHSEVPKAIFDNSTGIEAIDKEIRNLKSTGYMHNHMRMYVASIACNFGGAHWKNPAQWMYYHLLDGDWASNALSWQWVAGSNANKKYFVNQDNINKFWYSNQRNTFLDCDYKSFPLPDVPAALQESARFESTTDLPNSVLPNIDPGKPTCLYNYYNLDPSWRTNEDHNRVLILEPSFYEKYPVSEQCIQFALGLGKNIAGLQVYTGEIDELFPLLDPKKTFYKEHPLSKHYPGNEDSRDWMFALKGYFPSFFAFWKELKKETESIRRSEMITNILNNE